MSEAETLEASTDAADKPGAVSDAQSDIIVHFENVQKTYDGENLVVKDLNLEIERGEFLTLLGPSGSGKSTCLMMLAGFESLTSGKILLNGKELQNVPAYKRDVGVVFQSYALFPHMTVAENVAFPLSIRKVAKAEREERVQKALDMVQLGEFADRAPSQLSGGQRQRVALARALIFNPQLVLLDEPLGALDKKLREHMQIEIKHIHENLGVTMVFVTHDQDEALTMSDRVAVFNDGVIQQIDTPAALYERPINSFVANFLGDTNMIAGEVVEINGDFVTVKAPCNGHIHALRVQDLQVGDKTSLAIRPERVEISREDPNDDNAIEAEVVEVIYHGSHVRVVMQGYQGELRAMIRSGNPLATVKSGEKIYAYFKAEDCRALDYAEQQFA